MKPVVVQSPSHVLAPEVVIAASKAGASGVLDVSFSDAKDALQQCHDNCAPDSWGVRWEFQTEPSHALENFARIIPGRVPLIIIGGPLSDPESAVQFLRNSTAEVIVEACNVSEAQIAITSGADGVILRGSDAAGWVGKQSSFILLQEANKKLKGNFWIAGALGIRAARAATLLGASGVVLNEVLWQTREMRAVDPKYDAWRNLDGSESRLFGKTFQYRFDQRFGKATLAELDLDKDLSWLGTVINPAAQNSPIAVGQAVAFAERYGKKYHSVGGIVTAYMNALDRAPAPHIFTSDTPLCRAHGTRFPIVQGPMTRVSDEPHFLAEVARNGALPFLALAERSASETDSLLNATALELKGMPWGVGLLGFLPPAQRESQMALVAKYKPPFALIAGGNANHALSLERLGIATYLHAPSPRLFEIFIRKGVRRFVLEGNECGGHVGPRSSLLLWESIAEIVLDHGEIAPQISLLAAGGIHDEFSASAASEIFSPLAQRGCKVGVLSGSAYLFTHEVVATHAIVPQYQRMVSEASETVLLESGRGYQTRCLKTPYASQFSERRTELEQLGKSSSEILEELERLNVGRLRVASKGLRRRDATNTELRPASLEEQLNDGLYMVGDVVAVMQNLVSMEELHRNIARGVPKVPVQQSPRVRDQVRRSAHDIAITAMECILPGAKDLEAYWRNILNKTTSIREVPQDRWDKDLYFEEDRLAEDKTYSKWGGFIDELPFNPLVHGIPPSALSSISANQLLALEVARRAINSSGLNSRSELMERTSVIFGSADAGELGGMYAFRTLLPQYLALIDDLSPEMRNQLQQQMNEQLPRWSGDSLPGILQNIVAGRIANRLNLGGVNFTVDAACATSFAALDVAVQMLRNGSCDAALVGAVDTSNSAISYTAFSKTHALSPSGTCRPFDEAADGIVLGEGVAAVVLRPLEAAERDGDRIYAVIRGIGRSSDGRHESLTAPYVPGQERAMREAYLDADIEPSSVGLIEAHGTGTVIGDKAEISGLTNIYADANPSSVALGSVKSMIGHTKTVAGFAGMIKAALALDQKIFPPTVGVSNPNAALVRAESPFYLATTSRPWLNNSSYPRRAAVSAFGFGGTNYHLVLEEHSADWQKSHKRDSLPRDCELVFMSASDRGTLCTLLKETASAIDSEADFTEQALNISRRNNRDTTAASRIAIVVHKDQSLRERLLEALELIESGDATKESGIYFTAASDPPGKLCFLFPGQGSQRKDMLKDLLLGSSWAFKGFQEADALLSSRLERPLTEHIFPLGEFDMRPRIVDKLYESELSQPALLLMNLFASDLLSRYGVRPDMAAGHSLGEYSALSAAGAFSREDLLVCAYERSKLCLRARSGGLVAVSANEKEALKILAESNAKLVFAGSNSPRQSIFGGLADEIASFLKFTRSRRIPAVPLTVIAPYHTPFMNDCLPGLKVILDDAKVSSTTFPVFSNATGTVYPSEPSKMKELLMQHLVEPLRFSKLVDNAYQLGARIFIEVGPGDVLSRIVNEFQFPNCRVLSLEGIRPGWPGLAYLLGELYSLGQLPKWETWFEGRADQSATNDKLRNSLETSHRLSGRGIRDLSNPAPRESRDTNNERMRSSVALRFLPTLRVAPVFGSDVLLDARKLDPSLETEPSKSVPSDFLELLTSTVSECTGYPREMLNLDLDLVSELGVDSIKRVEIASKLLEADPTIAQGDEDQIFSELIRLRTLRDILHWQDARLRRGHVAVASDEASSSDPSNCVIKRYSVEAVIAEEPPNIEANSSGAYFPKGTAAILLGDKSQEVDCFVQALKDIGIEQFVIADLDTGNQQYIFNELQRMNHRAAALFYFGGAIRRGGSSVRGFFRLLREFLACQSESRMEFVPWIGSFTAFGGQFALDGKVQTDVEIEDAGIFGILKTLARENPKVKIRCIDRGPGLSADEFAKRSLMEFLRSERFSEIGLKPKGRCQIKAKESPYESNGSGLEISSDSLLLITGGLSGITFETTRLVAETYSPKLVLIGRSSVTDERRKNLSELKKVSPEVEYHQMDLRAPQEFAALLEDLYRRKGRIDGVIHGAGQIDDMLINEKSLESFEAVYRTKTAILPVLSQGLDPHSLKFVCLFSSVAGRFGSIGQADYAAANEVLNKWACKQQQIWPNTNIVSINWGPWSGGMLSKELSSLYRRAKIELIPFDVGARMFIEELRCVSRRSPEVIISGSLEKIAAFSLLKPTQGAN